MIKVISNIYRVNKKSSVYDEYFITFGNLEWGFNCNKEDLKETWRKAVKLSASKYYGDVTLLCRGKIIRGVSNFNNRILDKEAKYKCKYTKYK